MTELLYAKLFLCLPLRKEQSRDVQTRGHVTPYPNVILAANVYSFRLHLSSPYRFSRQGTPTASRSARLTAFQITVRAQEKVANDVKAAARISRSRRKTRRRADLKRARDPDSSIVRRLYTTGGPTRAGASSRHKPHSGADLGRRGSLVYCQPTTAAASFSLFVKPDQQATVPRVFLLSFFLFRARTN